MRAYGGQDQVGFDCLIQKRAHYPPPSGIDAVARSA